MVHGRRMAMRQQALHIADLVGLTLFDSASVDQVGEFLQCGDLDLNSGGGGGGEETVPYDRDALKQAVVQFGLGTVTD